MNYLWTPAYTTAKGTVFTVPGVQSEDCPASAITPESNTFLLRYHRTKRASDLGIQTQPPGETLSRDLDAFLAIEAEQSQLDQSREEAESAEKPGGQD